MTETTPTYKVENSAEPKKSSKKRGGGLKFLVLLAIILGLAWYGWQQWQSYQHQAQLKQQQAAAALEQKNQQQKQWREEQQRLIDGLSAQVASLSDQAIAQGQRLAQLSNGGELAWLLNEAKTLASLAEQRLLLTADLPSTYQLLEAADKTLAQLDDPKALIARRALAADKERVRSAQQIDTTELLLQLGAMVDELQQITLPELTDKSKVAEAEEPEMGWWQTIISRLPLSIQRYEDDLPLPLSVTQLAQIRLSLSMDFQQAQLALLQGKPKMYSQALSQASQTLNTYFLQSDTRVKHLQSRIDELQAVDINQTLPHIGAGLEAIKALLSHLAEG